MFFDKRYVVMKLSDIDQSLGTALLNRLNNIQEMVNDYRIRVGKGPLDGIVIESDWPEYDEVCKKLSDRIEGKECEITEEFRAGAKAMFDYVMYRAANNYSEDCDIQEQCDYENKIVESWITDALAEVDDYAYQQWESISKLKQENKNLQEILDIVISTQRQQITKLDNIIVMLERQYADKVDSIEQISNTIKQVD